MLELLCDATFWRNIHAHWHVYSPTIGIKVYCVYLEGEPSPPNQSHESVIPYIGELHPNLY